METTFSARIGRSAGILHRTRGGGTSFSLNPLKSGSVAAYPTVEAAEEVSEEETADALESDEPSDEEEAATEEESTSEDIEAGEEEDLSISDVTEEDEEVVEEIEEEEEVVEETEEADAEDPSFSDSEDTSDTTETEAVEEEAEEEEEVVEEETEEEETEAADSEATEVVEEDAAEELQNAGDASLTIALANSSSPLYVGKNVSIKVTPENEEDTSYIESAETLTALSFTIKTSSGDSTGTEYTVRDVASLQPDGDGVYTVEVPVPAIMDNGSIKAKATWTNTYKTTDEGTATSGAGGSNVNSNELSSISTTNPLSDLTPTISDLTNRIGSNSTTDYIGIWQDGEKSDGVVIAGHEQATATASLSDATNGGEADFIEYAWTWDPAGESSPANKTYWTYSEGNTAPESGAIKLEVGS